MARAAVRFRPLRLTNGWARTPGVDDEPRLIATRPLDKREALDQSLAEAVLCMRNDPKVAMTSFVAMRDTLASAPDAETLCRLLKKLTATALSSWTAATCAPEAFAVVAAAAGFSVATYGPTATVVREPAYPSTTGPLLKSVCRAFAAEVLKPGLKRLRTFKKASAETKAFATHLPALVRTGSLEDSTTPKIPPAPRFAIE